MSTIWDHFPAFINLQLQIKRMNVPPRPTKPTELQALFGFTLKEAKEPKVVQKVTKKGKKKADVNDADDEENAENGSAEEEQVELEGDVELTQGVDDNVREERVKRRDEQINRMKELGELHNQVTLILKACSKFKKDTGRTDQKDPKSNWANITAPWTRASKLTGDTVANARFPGKQTWRFHTAEYSAISLSSYYRHMPTFAAMILAEASAVISYRPALIQYQLDGGAALLRYTFEEVCEDSIHATKQKTPGLVQKTLPHAKSKAASKTLPLDYTEPPTGTITWPDGIYNRSYAPRDFYADYEMVEFQRDAKLGNQERLVQKALDFISAIPCAWADQTGALKARDKPALYADLIPCLEQMATVCFFSLLKGRQLHVIQILSDNAYIQRMYPHEDDFDPMNARFPDEKLRVHIRGQTQTKSLSLREIESRPFYVYTRREAEEHLEALRTEFEKEILQSDEREVAKSSSDESRLSPVEEVPDAPGTTYVMFVSTVLHHSYYLS